MAEPHSGLAPSAHAVVYSSRELQPALIDANRRAQADLADCFSGLLLAAAFDEWHREFHEAPYLMADQGETTMSNRCFAVNTLLVLALATSFIGSLAAEEAPPANGPTAQMLVTVEAIHGSNVPAIGREDVMVYEGHDRDKVTNWVPAQGDHAGLDLVVLLDDGANSSLSSQLGDLRQVYYRTACIHQDWDRLYAERHREMEQKLTSDHALAAKALRLPTGIRGINGSPYFSLTDLIKHWPESTARREVLMVSDGIDRYYGGGDMLDPYLAAAIEDAQRAGVVVFVSIPRAWVTLVIATGEHIGVSFTSRRLRRRPAVKRITSVLLGRRCPSLLTWTIWSIG